LRPTQGSWRYCGRGSFGSGSRAKGYQCHDRADGRKWIDHAYAACLRWKAQPSAFQRSRCCQVRQRSPKRCERAWRPNWRSAKRCASSASPLRSSTVSSMLLGALPNRVDFGVFNQRLTKAAHQKFYCLRTSRSGHEPQKQALLVAGARLGPSQGSFAKTPRRRKEQPKRAPATAIIALRLRSPSRNVTRNSALRIN
jgi:hypothetical protein